MTSTSEGAARRCRRRSSRARPRSCSQHHPNATPDDVKGALVDGGVDVKGSTAPAIDLQRADARNAAARLVAALPDGIRRTRPSLRDTDAVGRDPLDRVPLDRFTLDRHPLDGESLDGIALDGFPVDGLTLDGFPLDRQRLDRCRLDREPLDRESLDGCFMERTGLGIDDETGSTRTEPQDRSPNRASDRCASGARGDLRAHLPPHARSGRPPGHDRAVRRRVRVRRRVQHAARVPPPPVLVHAGRGRAVGRVLRARADRRSASRPRSAKACRSRAQRVSPLKTIYNVGNRLASALVAGVVFQSLGHTGVDDAAAWAVAIGGGAVLLVLRHRLHRRGARHRRAD